MQRQQPEPRYLAVARVLRPHGVRGEVRAEILSEYPEHLLTLKRLYLGDEYEPCQVESARLHKQFALIKLAGIEDRDAAEALRTRLLSVAIEDAIPLDTDEYYDFQLEGLDVVTDTGDLLGEIVEVLTVPGANDVFVVHGPRGEILIPVIEDVIIALDLEAGHIKIHPLPGLLD